ncbi:MAG: hypothetical protein K8S87_12275 [Planctomycetes bacterium]|nr:hypothetical protein [Planctomycetota bacterium]
MNSREFAHLLLNEHKMFSRNEIIEEELRLATVYLEQLLMLHKFIDFLKDQNNIDKNLKKIQIYNFTRIIEGFVTANHMLDARYYNSALTELRNNYETLNIIKLITVKPNYLKLYLSQDSSKILNEFQPMNVRKEIGKQPYDVLHNFLISYYTHPFYTGNEFLLSVDIKSEGDQGMATRIFHPTLDIVVALLILVSYTHMYYQASTGFGGDSLIPSDKDNIVMMFSNVERFMKKYYEQVKDHRFFSTVIDDFFMSFTNIMQTTKMRKIDKIDIENLKKTVKDMPRNKAGSMYEIYEPEVVEDEDNDRIR